MKNTPNIWTKLGITPAKVTKCNYLYPLKLERMKQIKIRCQHFLPNIANERQVKKFPMKNIIEKPQVTVNCKTISALLKKI